MKRMTFEEFLNGIHIDLYPEILDDDLPDRFNDWLATLDVEDYLKWGELYGKNQFMEGELKILKQELEKITKNYESR